MKKTKQELDAIAADLNKQQLHFSDPLLRHLSLNFVVRESNTSLLGAIWPQTSASMYCEVSGSLYYFGYHSVSLPFGDDPFIAALEKQFIDNTQYDLFYEHPYALKVWLDYQHHLATKTSS